MVKKKKNRILKNPAYCSVTLMTAGLKFLRTSAGVGGEEEEEKEWTLFLPTNGGKRERRAGLTVQTLRRYLLVREKINRFGLDRNKKKKVKKKG